MCGTDFECDVGYVLADATAPGVSKKDCCQPKCQLFECTAPWAPSAAKKDVVASSAEECCEKTCAAVNCSLPGWAPNKSKELEIGSTPEDCCTPLCGNSAQVKCPFGSAVKDEDVNKTSDGTDEGCCAPQCKAYKCSDGFAPNVAKDEAFGASDEVTAASLQFPASLRSTAVGRHNPGCAGMLLANLQEVRVLHGNGLGSFPCSGKRHRRMPHSAAWLPASSGPAMPRRAGCPTQRAPKTTPPVPATAFAACQPARNTAAALPRA